MERATIDRRQLPADMRLWDWAGPDGWSHRRAHWPQGGAQAKSAAPRGSLLFAGGRGDFIEKYLEALGDWHREGWDVSSLDWRGQGKSRGRVDGARFTSFDILIRDAQALVADWMATTPGPHVIVGHSMGGHLMLRLLVDKAPAIAALVLVAPMIQVNSAPAPIWLGQVIAGSAVRFGFGGHRLWRSKAPLDAAPAGSMRQNILTSCPDRYGDEEFWWRQSPDLEPTTPSFSWLRSAYRSARAFSAHRLAAITTPVLIVATERDRLVSHAAIQRAASQIQGAELALFNDAAHEILRERNPIRSAAMARIDRFLRQRL